jgi:hypothetical protein
LVLQDPVLADVESSVCMKNGLPVATPMTEFPVFSESDVLERLREWLNLDGVETKLLDRLCDQLKGAPFILPVRFDVCCACVAGRPRFVYAFLAWVWQELAADHDTSSSQGDSKTARSKSDVLSGLFARWQSRMYWPFDDKSSSSKIKQLLDRPAKEVPESLCVSINTLLTKRSALVPLDTGSTIVIMEELNRMVMAVGLSRDGTVRFAETAAADFVNGSVCHLERAAPAADSKSKDKGGYVFRVGSEPMVLEAARRVLRHYGKGSILSASSDLARDIIDTCGDNSSAKVAFVSALLDDADPFLKWSVV